MADTNDITETTETTTATRPASRLVSGVLPNLYAFHYYTRNSAYLSDTPG